MKYKSSGKAFPTKKSNRISPSALVDTSDIPAGTNEQSARDSYKESDKYDLKYPHRTGLPSPIDVRANIRGLYGKVDVQGFAVIPKVEYISEILSDADQTHEALLIVKECFEEMADYYKQLDFRGKLSLDSKTLKEILPLKSWKNPMLSYGRHYDNIISEFISIKDTDLPEIIDYKTFEKSFMEYALLVKKHFTMSGYLVSAESDHRHTGLVIDLAVEDYSKDKIKYENYIQDSNFNVFRSVVNRHGFRIDKHIPWRIYFDITHPYSKRKLAKYGIGNYDDFFTKYYTRVVDLEIDGFDSVMNNSYKKYFKEDETYFQKKYSNKAGKTITSLKKREVMTLSKLQKIYNKDHWIRAYIYFRAIETGKNWNQAKFEKVVTDAISTNKYKNKNQMILSLEPYFLDKTNELFHRRDLTKQNSFGNIITQFKF